ncbi:TPA: lanthionine synthetase LanC family protein [Elizabethkingia anophelis]
MNKKRVVELLERINEIIFPIEHVTDLDKNKYALLSGDSLFSGNLGLVLYHFYYYKVFANTAAREQMFKLLQNILDRVEEGKSTLINYTLSYGFSGLGMVLELIKRDGLINPDDVEIENINELIFEWALDRIQNDDSEYMHGAFGAILYLAENPNSGLTTEDFDALIEALAQKAIFDDSGGIYFDMFSQFIPDYPKGSINLSLSHGLSGILIILADLIKKKLIGDKHRNLVYKIAKYLSVRIEDVDFAKNIFCHSESVFSIENRGRTNTRLAWCYGDLNQVLALLRAGQILEDENFTSLSKKIGLTTTKRKTYKQTYISESQFCHGTSGLVYVYGYLYVQTSIAEYKTAKNYWLDQTVELLQKELDTDYYTQVNRNSELLEGLLGVALVLLSEVGNEQGQELEWNRIFLLN